MGAADCLQQELGGELGREGRLRYLFGAAALSLLLAGTAARAIEPKPISSARQIKDGMGAVQISVQSQVQLLETLHVFFVREGGNPANSADLLKFERKQGVPLLGENMVDSKPRVSAVKPGRYRLLAHTVGCGTLPPANAVCSVGGTRMPTARYGDGSPAFEVLPGRLTVAGEFILEAPPGWQIGEGKAVKVALRDPVAFQIRVRGIASARAPAFASLPAGPAMAVPDEFRSTIQCHRRPKGAMMYLPFTC